MAIFKTKKYKKQTITSDGVMDKLGVDPEKIKNSKANKQLQKEYEKSIMYGVNQITNHKKRQEWINFLTQLDMRQWCNVLVWKNIPNGLTSWLINQMLYYRGALIGFKTAGKFYILPYAQTKGGNIYGLPNAVIPITYNGSVAGNQPLNNLAFKKKGFELIVNNYGDLNSKAKAVILYASTPFWASGIPIPTYSVNQSIISQMADILARVNIQITNSNIKMLLKLLDGKQAQEVLNQLNQLFSSDSPFGVISGVNVETVEMQPKTENASDLWMHFTSFTNLKNTSNGINNTGTFEKKERENRIESSGDSQSVDLTLQDRLKMAKQFIEQLRLIYPDDPEIALFDVEINPEIEQDEVIESESDNDVSDNNMDI